MNTLEDKLSKYETLKLNEEDNLFELGTICFSIGSEYFKLNKRDLALSFYTKGNNYNSLLSNKIETELELLEGDEYILKLDYYYLALLGSRNYQKIISIFSNELVRSKDILNNVFKCKYLERIAASQFSLKMYKDSKETYLKLRKLINVLKEKNELKLLELCLKGLSDACYMGKDYKLALTTRIELSKVLSSENHDAHFGNYNLMGMISIKNNDKKGAKAYFAKSLKLVKNNLDEFGLEKLMRAKENYENVMLD